MTCVSVESSIHKINSYISDDSNPAPYFVVVNGYKEYADILNNLPSNLVRIYTSSYCNDESFPNYDALYQSLIREPGKKVILGLGESISLGGDRGILHRIKDIYCDSKIVVLCRSIDDEIRNMSRIDNKFNEYRRICFVSSGRNFTITKYNLKLKVNVDAHNFKELLRILEEGKTDEISVNTELNIETSKIITKAYQIIKQQNPKFNIPEGCLPDEFWGEYLLDSNCDNYPITHWRTYLLFLNDGTNNPYVSYVINNVDNYGEYQDKIISGLLSLSSIDNYFWDLYAARKKLLSKIKDQDIAAYVLKTTKFDETRVCYLTDNTSEEKRAIIEEIAHRSIIPAFLKNIYPDLYDYLQEFIFPPKSGQIFTHYFSTYKQLKVMNLLTPEFSSQVATLAEPGQRKYNALNTRDSIIEKFNPKTDTLYWIDALGVEYLGFIQNKAKGLGLKITIDIARSELPTLTEYNKDFYEGWPGKKISIKGLDDIKHNKGNTYNGMTPAYLCDELDILIKCLEWIKTELVSKRAIRFIITSDHGASRLAVTSNHENKWNLSASKGEHSGRCCPVNDIDTKPDCATEENNYWVLANYDRFKGGRKADIEVHGGASLEEVIVPVISLSLSNTEIRIEILTPVVMADNYKTIPIITLYSESELDDLHVSLMGNIYIGIKDSTNSHKFNVTFDNIRKSGTYTVDVYSNDNLIDQVEFKIQNTLGSAKDDDFFN